MLAKFLKIVLF